MTQSKRIKRAAMLLCAIASGATHAVNVSSTLTPKVVKLVADPWCPFTCDPKSEKPGLIIEIAREAFALKGLKVNYESVSWARAVSDTRENKFDGVAGALQSDAPDFIFPPLSWISQKSCFFVRKGSKWQYKGLDSLSKVTLGLVKDYSYGAPLDDYVKRQSPQSKRLNFVSGTQTALKLLKLTESNRIDVMVEDKSVVIYSLGESGEFKNENFVNVGCLKSVPLYVAFGPKNARAKEYSTALSAGYLELKKTKRLNEIFARYGLENK